MIKEYSTPVNEPVIFLMETFKRIKFWWIFRKGKTTANVNEVIRILLIGGSLKQSILP